MYVNGRNTIHDAKIDARGHWGEAFNRDNGREFAAFLPTRTPDGRIRFGHSGSGYRNHGFISVPIGVVKERAIVNSPSLGRGYRAPTQGQALQTALHASFAALYRNIN